MEGSIVTPTETQITLGYCPTMEPYVRNLLESHPNLISKRYDNASSALQALSSESVNAVIIGRVARKNEINEGINIIRIDDGFTLIAQQQATILFEDLANVNILTLAEEVEVKNLFPQGTNIEHFQDYNQLLSDMDQNSAILLRWSEVPDEYQLLIPVDGQGNKIPHFRAGHFYYQESNTNDLLRIIEEFSPTY